jgi:hypothetical protein
MQPVLASGNEPSESHKSLCLPDATSIQRYCAFLERGASDRPLFVAEIGYLMPDVFPALCKRLPSGPLHPDDIRVDLILEDVERLYDESSQLGDDLPFVAMPFPYLPWMEAILGCPISMTDNSLWAGPCVEDWRTWHWQQPSLDSNPWAQKLLEIVKALIEYSCGRFQVPHTLMRGVADMLCAMRGASRFVLDFFDFPQAVHQACELLADVWIEVARAQLDLLQPSDNGYVGSAGWRVWAPDPPIWLQEDAMALLSPSLFREFILPQDRRILSQFQFSAFHLHASALWAVTDLVHVPDLDVVELNHESACIDEEATFEAWKKIQEHKPLVIWKEYDGNRFLSWLDRISQQLTKQGLLLHITTANFVEALQAKQAILATQW